MSYVNALTKQNHSQNNPVSIPSTCVLELHCTVTVRLDLAWRDDGLGQDKDFTYTYTYSIYGHEQRSPGKVLCFLNPHQLPLYTVSVSLDTTSVIISHNELLSQSVVSKLFFFLMRTGWMLRFGLNAKHVYLLGVGLASRHTLARAQPLVQTYLFLRGTYKWFTEISVRQKQHLSEVKNYCSSQVQKSVLFHRGKNKQESVVYRLAFQSGIMVCTTVAKTTGSPSLLLLKEMLTACPTADKNVTWWQRGDQCKRQWYHYSTSITLCNQYLSHNDMISCQFNVNDFGVQTWYWY